ncbi:hypothetical protein Btru_076140 [Bulinus truncatus]|nr:hypothetical protein Btru_076140 [Bulinus truncatus]
MVLLGTAMGCDMMGFHSYFNQQHEQQNIWELQAVYSFLDCLEWCSMGKCKFDTSAPLTTDCPLGDYVTKVNGKTCSSAVKETPSLCNNDEVKKQCCKSCKDISSGNPSKKISQKSFGKVRIR